MGKVVKKGDQIVITLSVEEAELASVVLLEGGFYAFDAGCKATYQALDAALWPVPLPAAKAKYTCAEKGCYKFGHTFSEKGWNGDPAKGIKGHIDVSPFHTR